MARLRVVIGHDPELLLRAAADGFLTPRRATAQDPFPTVPYLLALRQGGLRDDVIAMASDAQVKGWFDPPLCIFHELSRWLGAPARRMLGEFERLVILSRIVADDASGVFGALAHCDDFIAPIDRLFGELISEGVTGERFARALESRADRDDFARRRDASLGAAYTSYLAELARLGKADGREEWIHCATSIRADDGALAFALGGRRELRIFGLQDLRRGWLHLIRALAHSKALDLVTLYTSVELPLGDLPYEIERMPEQASHPAPRLFERKRAQDKVGEASLVIAPDVDREMDRLALDIRALVDAGVPPHRIAVVAREARPNLDRALVSLAKVGVPATARRRVDLTAIPVVRALTTLLSAAADGWTRRGLVELGRQPYIDCGLDTEVVNAIGFKRLVTGLSEWSRALDDLEREARRFDMDDAPERDGKSRPSTTRIAEARAKFARFEADARALDESRSLRGWLDWLASFLSEDPWKIRAAASEVIEGRYEIVRLDLAGWTSIASVVQQWRDAIIEHDDDPREMSIAQFNARLKGILSGDVPLWTPEHRGVQVLEALAAAYRSFDYVFLAGMKAGAFPKGAPTSPVLNEAERDALAAAGLPLDRREVWDQRERELFRILVAGARMSFAMSYARLDDAGREVIGSAFVEELSDISTVRQREIAASQVVLPKMSLYRTAGGPEQALHAATIERERLRGVRSPHNGSIDAPDLTAWLETEFGNERLWSPSQLEEFAKCPWAYFSKRLLRIEKLEDVNEDIDAATRGSLLHAALKEFYDSASVRVGGAVFLRESDKVWARELAKSSIAAAIASYPDKGRLGHPALREAKRAELERIIVTFLEWEIQMHEDMLDPKTKKVNAPKMIRSAVESHELAFTDMIYEHDGVRIRYRGSIDRVEVSVDERADGVDYIVAADYKSSKSATPGAGRNAAWEEGVVLQVPLYAYALSQLRHTAEIARAGYLTLKNPEPAQTLDLVKFDKKLQEVSPQPGEQDKWAAALHAAIDHVKRARLGDFPAGPPGECTCPPWCHGRDICRIPGGPVSS